MVKKNSLIKMTETCFLFQQIFTTIKNCGWYRRNNFYRQHCTQRKAPVFKLLRGRFWRFLPRRGDTLHQCGWNSAWGCQISPHRCNGKRIGPPNLKFLLRFDQHVEYKRPAVTLRDFPKISTVCTPFQDVSDVKMSLDLLNGLWTMQLWA